MVKLFAAISFTFLASTSFAQGDQCKEEVMKYEKFAHTFTDYKKACDGIIISGDFETDKSAIADVKGAFDLRSKEYDFSQLGKNECSKVTSSAYNKFSAARDAAAECLAKKSIEQFVKAPDSNQDAKTVLERAQCLANLSDAKDHLNYITRTEKRCHEMKAGGFAGEVLKSTDESGQRTENEYRKKLISSHTADFLKYDIEKDRKEMRNQAATEIMVCKGDLTKVTDELRTVEKKLNACYGTTSSASESTRVSNKTVKTKKSENSTSSKRQADAPIDRAN